MKSEEISFEKAAAELEGIVEKLEKGELTLDESIDFFKRGVELSRYCSRRLDEAERRITLLMENENGETVEKDFPGGNDGFQNRA